MLAGITAVILVYALVLYLTGTPDRTFSNLGLVTVGALGAINCILAAYASTGRLRIAWVGLAGGSLLWAAGQAVWAWYELVLQVEVPFPGLVDVGYLGYPIGALIGLAVFPSNVTYADRRRMALDAMTTACAIAIVSWATALGAVVSAGGTSAFSTAVSVAYPLSDIVLLVVCVMVLSRSRTHRAPLGFIAISLVLMSVSDSGFAYLVATGSYSTGHPIDLGWLFAPGFLAIATITRGATATDSQVNTQSIAGTFLPYIPLGAAVGVVTWQYATNRLTPVETVLAAMIVLLVLLRQFLTVHDNRHLTVALSASEDELRQQAFHDVLTGLANRALFVDRVAHALELHRGDGRPLAICFLDLDGFKAVNDTLGHSAGDYVLKEASSRFHSILTDADTLARFGGDEFAVLLEGSRDPVEVGHALLDSLRAPFVIDGREMAVLASVGVAKLTPMDPTPTVDELLVRADLAMYVVKGRGKRDVLLHTADMYLEEVDDMALGRALALALANKGLTVAYQPIVDLATGQLDTLEALARWAPRGRSIEPEEFVRVADRCHLVDPLFRFVLSEVCERLSQWSLAPGGADIRVAVNIGPAQLSSRELPAYIAAELARHGLAGNRLILEITERGGLLNLDDSRHVCDELRALGVRLSVDDFGTGWSTLARLRDLPIDEVKIDRSFVSGVDLDDARRLFVSGVLAFAERVGILVVAEGIENAAERDVLVELGCQRAQGFLFSAAMPAESVPALLKYPGNWLRGRPVPEAVPVAVAASVVD